MIQAEGSVNWLNSLETRTGASCADEASRIQASPAASSELLLCPRNQLTIESRHAVCDPTGDVTIQMKLLRRDFVRVGGCWLASLTVRPLWAEPEGKAESAPPRVVLTWGTNGHADGQFDVPIAIVVNQKDEILVTDFRQTNLEAKGRLQRFDPAGRFLGAFEVEPMPGGLALDKDGLLYATHMMKHKVAVYDQVGKLVREFGKLGTAPGDFQQPGGIAFGPDGTVYVADQVNRRVQRLTPQGEPISAWGKYGVNPGEFGGNVSAPSRVGGPHFLAFNSQGDFYTTEGSVGRTQKFKSDGTFVLAWGDNEVWPGPFWRRQVAERSHRNCNRLQGPGLGEFDEPLRPAICPGRTLCSRLGWRRA